MSSSLVRVFITELKRQLEADRRMARRLAEERYAGLTCTDGPISCEAKGEFDHYGDADEQALKAYGLLAA